MEQNVIEINGEITLNADVSVRNIIYVKNVWNPSTCTCNCDNGKYLASIMNDSAIIWDEVIDADAKLSPKDNFEAKTTARNFNEKKVTCKMQKLYISCAFLLSTIALLIDVSIYCYLIKSD